MLVAAVAAAASCVSPTLPLPPPSEPETIARSEGSDLWTVAGTCKPGSTVTVFNEETDRGVVVIDSDFTGRYAAQIEATECDFGWVSLVFEGDASGRTGFVFREVSQGLPVDSSKCK